MVQNTCPRIDNTLEESLAALPTDTPFLAHIRSMASTPVIEKPVALLQSPDDVATLFEGWRHANVDTREIVLALAPEKTMLCQMAAVLASMPSALPFHNSHHTREVVYLSMVLSQKLSRQARTEIFIAACIHDFAHDGKGNRRGANHTPMRLERRALDMSRPFLLAAGMDDTQWARITAMVLATDVSKDDSNATSPSEWMRRAVKGEQAGANCPAEFAPFFLEKSLAHHAGILEDADLGTSAGMPYQHACRMTALVAEETGVLAPNSQTLVGFLDHICHGAFITREALEFFGDSIPALRARADEENADTIYRWS